MRIETTSMLFHPYPKSLSSGTLNIQKTQSFLASTLSKGSSFAKIKEKIGGLLNAIWDWIKWVVFFNWLIPNSTKTHEIPSLMEAWNTLRSFFESTENNEIIFTLNLSVKKTAKYQEISNFRKHLPHLKSVVRRTEIDIKQREDILNVALQLKKDGFNPLVVNPGHPLMPGGSYKSGASGPEPETCRRTGLAFTLDTKLNMQKRNLYPIINSQVIYSPNVPVVLDGNYASIEPKCLSFVTSAPLDSPPLTKNNQYVNEEDSEEMERRIYAQLLTGYSHNHDVLVLSPFGCGILNNPPKVVAKMYVNIIKKYFPKNFKKIVFVILPNNLGYGKGDSMSSFAAIIRAYGKTIT